MYKFVKCNIIVQGLVYGTNVNEILQSMLDILLLEQQSGFRSYTGDVLSLRISIEKRRELNL